MAIIPDTKDWTWVVEKPCPECGFVASALSIAEVGAFVRHSAAAMAVALERADAAERPNDATWSPLEYAAHVLDVLRLYRERLSLMLQTDNPLYPNWDQDAAAIAGRYDERDPLVVAGELLPAASDIADAFDAVEGDGWQRPGRRGDGATFTVHTFAQYLAHDLAHHVWDVTRQSVAEVPVEE